MKKIFLLFAAILIASTGMWAKTVNNVKYLDAKGVEQTENDVTELTGTDEDFTTLSAGWYVVNGADVQTKTLVCNGDVHIILTDDAKLTVTGWSDAGVQQGAPGIKVSGDGNSFTVYGQAAQSGQLIITGGYGCAGIGGGENENGSNITINGGMITVTSGDNASGIGGGSCGSGIDITINGGTVEANGGNWSAGIGGGSAGDGKNITINGGTVVATSNSGAGIGGGYNGNGSYITVNGGTVTATSNAGAGIGGGAMQSGSQIHINGGMVTATGGVYQGLSADGIGGGVYGGRTDIFVATDLIVKAGDTENPTDVITNTGSDIASRLWGNRYVVIIDPNMLSAVKAAAVAEIDDAVEDVTNEDIRAIAIAAKTNIDTATTETDINAIKEKALYDIELAIAFYNTGKGDAIGSLGEKQDGPAIEVIDQDNNSIILYNPKKVNFIKVSIEE